MTLKRGLKSLSLSLINKDDIPKTLLSWKRELEEFCLKSSGDITNIYNEIINNPTGWDTLVKKTVTTDYTMVAADNFICIDSECVGWLDIDLPLAASVDAGRIVVIKHYNAAAVFGAGSGIYIKRQGTDTIDDSNTLRIDDEYGGVMLVSDGASLWHIIATALDFTLV